MTAGPRPLSSLWPCGRFGAMQVPVGRKGEFRASHGGRVDVTGSARSARLGLCITAGGPEARGLFLALWSPRGLEDTLWPPPGWGSTSDRRHAATCRLGTAHRKRFSPGTRPGGPSRQQPPPWRKGNSPGSCSSPFGALLDAPPHQGPAQRETLRPGVPRPCPASAPQSHSSARSGCFTSPTPNTCPPIPVSDTSVMDA